MMPELTLEVLGPLRARRDGVELDLGSPQQRAVLAVLLLARGRHVAIETLIDALWGERSPLTAAGTVRNYISRLRRRLRPGPGWPDRDVIKLVGDGYTLRLGSALLDYDVFEKLTGQARAARGEGAPARAAALFADALALWQGSPLAGLPGPYAEAQRARMAEQRLAAAEDGLAAGIDSGDHLAAIPRLQELRAVYPLRERLSELLMLALYRSGRQADALTVFGGSRRLLHDELGIDPGPSLRDMQQRILEADTSLAVPTTAWSAVQPSAMVPSMLPRAPSDFTGRVYDLSAITAALTDPAARSPVVAICGMPGIGKTALAVQAALSVTHEFPDGQLFADLSDPDDTAASPDSVLTGLLVAMGLNAIQESGVERATAWRAALGRRRMIIVLDDLRDPAQVGRLLPPPPGCAVVITSRRRSLGLPGLRLFEISRLRPEESLRLLARLVGADRVAAEQAAAERLVELCAYQPLPIRAVGARLAMRPTWRISAIERQLREDFVDPTAIRADCELVEGPFRSAYNRLSPEEAMVFRRASATTGTRISVAATSAGLGVPEDVTRARLDSLAEIHHLIEPDTVSGEFRYDPLIKIYARRKAAELDGSRERERATSRG
jgi:DNA-binding SARP family transcriptional activator